MAHHDAREVHPLAPFGPKYHAARAKRGEGTADYCCICGEIVDVAKPDTAYVEIGDGGSSFLLQLVTEAERRARANDPGYMGWFPIGSGCRRKYRRELKPFVAASGPQLGKRPVECASLTPKQAALGRKIVRKYHRQLPAELIEVMKTAKEEKAD